MEVVICYCLECKAELGQFRNSWTGLGSTYYSPLYPMLTYKSGLLGVGQTYSSPPGSPIESCQLQDLSCKRCQTLLGMRCDSAPEGHILVKDQLILRLLKKMSLISQNTGEKANPNVIGTIPVDKPSAQQKTPVTKRASTVQPLSRKSSSLQSVPSGNHCANVSMPPPPRKENPTSDYLEFKSWAQEAIETQQKDIERVSGSLLHLEDEMQDFRKFMSETRTELATSREWQQNQRQNADRLSKVSEDLLQLQEQVSNNTEGLLGKSGESISRDIEIIISDMLQVSSKANEVDGLKFDLEQMQSQVELASQPHHSSVELDNLKLELYLFKGRLKLVEAALDKGPSSNGDPGAAQNNMQTQKRFPRVEIRAHRSNNAAELGSPRTGALNDQLRKNVSSSLKRKYGELERPSTAVTEQAPSESPLPTKKRRVSQRAGAEDESAQSRVRFQSPSAEVIEILSSEHGASPILDAHLRSNRNTEVRSKETKADQLSSTVALNDTDSVSSKPSRGRPRKGSIRRTASMNNLLTPSALPSKPDLTHAMGIRGRRSSMHLEKTKDAQASSVASSSKVDRRSLGSQKGIVDKENVRPVHESHRKKKEATQGTAQRHAEWIEKAAYEPPKNRKDIRSNSKSGVAQSEIMPSIERDDLDDIQAIASELGTVAGFEETQTTEPAFGLVAKSTTSQKQLQCGKCGKGYASASGLNYHKRNSDCAKADNAEQERKAKLMAREKLVKETLEREMAIGI